MSRKLVFIDCEVNSLTHREVIQFCSVEKGSPAVTHYYKPLEPIDIDTMSVHNITNEKLVYFDNFLDSGQLEHLSNLNKLGAVFIAHNASFDVDILDRYLSELKEPPIKNSICTLLVARHCYEEAMKTNPGTEVPKKYKLNYLRYFMGLLMDEGTNLHDAESDVAVLEAIFEYLMQKFELSLADMILITREQQKPENWRFYFGKYIGKSIGQVHKENPGYLEWLSSNVDDKELLERIVKFYEER